tara:strand:+ start:3393 stop:3692 length:300 start_codon:yes stop_codon:yes gene_type:complete
MTVTALRGKVIARLLEDPNKNRVTKGGVITLADNSEERGVRARWFQTISVGDEVDDITEGQYILVSHGRWTRGIEVDGEKIYGIDVPEILGTSEEMPDV